MHPLELKLAAILAPFYKGERYYCNLCGFKSSRLKWRGHSHPILNEKRVISAGKRQSDCPRCLSSDRDRLVWLYLKNQLSVGQNILHVAPELPLSLQIIQQSTTRNLNYQCIDKRAKGYFYPHWVKNMDVTRLEFENDFFDWVIANHVLEHIPDLASALKEIKRVLKPSGKAIVMVPMSSTEKTDEGCLFINNQWVCSFKKEERISRYGQHDHVRLFGTDFPTILQKQGLKLEPLHSTSFERNEKLIQSLKLFPDERLLIASPI
jgi:SAM-dependent methyltransferase